MQVLGDVLHEVGSRAALGRVDHFDLEAMFVRAGLVGVGTHGVVAQYLQQSGFVVGLHENQQVPMRRAVVVWFNNAQAEIFDAKPL